MVTGKRASPVVVEPCSVTGDNDVVGLFCHIVLARVQQPVHLHLPWLLILLQGRTVGMMVTVSPPRPPPNLTRLMQPAVGIRRKLTFPPVSKESSSCSSEKCGWFPSLPIMQRESRELQKRPLLLTNSANGARRPLGGATLTQVCHGAALHRRILTVLLQVHCREQAEQEGLCYVPSRQ